MRLLGLLRRRSNRPRCSSPGELEDPEDETGRAVARMRDATRHCVPGNWHIKSFLDSESVMPIVMAFLERNLG